MSICALYFNCSVWPQASSARANLLCKKTLCKRIIRTVTQRIPISSQCMNLSSTTCGRTTGITLSLAAQGESTTSPGMFPILGWSITCQVRVAEKPHSPDNYPGKRELKFECNAILFQKYPPLPFLASKRSISSACTTG